MTVYKGNAKEFFHSLSEEEFVGLLREVGFDVTYKNDKEIEYVEICEGCMKPITKGEKYIKKPEIGEYGYDDYAYLHNNDVCIVEYVKSYCYLVDEKGITKELFNGEIFRLP